VENLPSNEVPIRALQRGRMTVMLQGFLDNLYAYLTNARLRNRTCPFFSKGWGDQGAMEAVKERLLSGLPPADITIHWETPWRLRGGHEFRDGRFETPFFREFLPSRCKTAHFRLMQPTTDRCYPIYLHMAHTGEEGYTIREDRIAIPLLKRGIGALMLEYPFLGKRGPCTKTTARLDYVSDLLLLGGVAIEEARSLLVWLSGAGYNRLGVTGVSLGGYLATVTGALTSFPLAIVPCVAPHSGVPVFTEGLFSRSCDWTKLGSSVGGVDCARQRFRDLLKFTGVETFPPGKPTDSIISVAAIDDRVVPKHSSEMILRHLSGTEIRWVSGGHVSSILFQREAFRVALADAIYRL
jgi:hypothetical protein